MKFVSCLCLWSPFVTTIITTTGLYIVYINTAPPQRYHHNNLFIIVGLHQPDLQPRWITSGSCCTCSCSPQYSSVSCETSSPSPRPWSTKCPNRFVPCPRFRTSRTFLTAIKRPPQHHRRWRPTGKPMHECQLLLLFCIISPQWSDHRLSSSKKRPSLQSKHLGLSSFTRYSLDTPSRRVLLFFCSTYPF